MSESLEQLRREYEERPLDEREISPDPFVALSAWLGEALARDEILEPNAMTLATVDRDGRPSARLVLLRGLDERGLVFFTNYESHKARDLEINPAAAVAFYWAPLHKQVRVEGDVARISEAESDKYFAARPRGHRLSAWASPQSRPVEGRAALEAALKSVDERFAGVDVPRPAFWGGYRLVPRRFEFWQGRLNRVHDRILYERDGEGWRISRLAP